MKSIAINQIAVVKFCKGEVDPEWTWQDEKRFLGIKIKEAGFIRCDRFYRGISPLTKDDINHLYDSITVKRNQIWLVPCVKLNLSNRMTHHFYFKLNKEAKDFAKLIENAKPGQWLDCDTLTIKDGK